MTWYHQDDNINSSSKPTMDSGHEYSSCLEEVQSEGRRAGRVRNEQSVKQTRETTLIEYKSRCEIDFSRSDVASDASCYSSVYRAQTNPGKSLRPSERGVGKLPSSLPTELVCKSRAQPTSVLFILDVHPGGRQTHQMKRQMMRWREESQRLNTFSADTHAR